MKMRLILCTPFLLLFVSCFQLIEDVTVKQDGSGTAVFTANLSQSRSKLASIMLLDSVNGYKVPSKTDIQNHLAEIATELKKIPGISNVSHSADFDKFIATIRFSFNKVEDLNTIANKLFTEMKITSSNQSSYAYNKGGRTFSRTYVYEPKAKAEFEKLKDADKEVFNSATYTSIYRFDQPVLSQSNASAKLAASKKAVMMQSPILDLITGKRNMTNQIKLAN
ncbi:hypothetical protein [Parapedobacter defluvii]|nr:hypothetical protein [Parapedobacter defluvii]